MSHRPQRPSYAHTLPAAANGDNYYLAAGTFDGFSFTLAVGGSVTGVGPASLVSDAITFVNLGANASLSDFTLLSSASLSIGGDDNYVTITNIVFQSNPPILISGVGWVALSSLIFTSPLGRLIVSTAGSGSGLIIRDTWLQGAPVSSQGGAVYISNEQSLLIEDSTFANNQVTGNGGALYCSNCISIVLRRVALLHNSAPAGGVIACPFCNYIELSGCNATGNQAIASHGGVINAGNNGVDLSVIITDSVMMNNVALGSNGGVVFLDYAYRVEFLRSNFTGNSGTNGGVLFQDDAAASATLLFDGSRFIENEGLSGPGGVAYCSQCSQASVYHSTFVGCIGRPGGVFYLDAGSSTVDLLVEDSFADSCVAPGQPGGFAYISHPRQVIFRRTDLMNGMGSVGGMLYFSSIPTDNTELTMEDVTAQNFNSAGPGGVVYASSNVHRVVLRRCSFTDNHSNGGPSAGFYVGGGTSVPLEFEAEDTHFLRNRISSGSPSGALYLDYLIRLSFIRGSIVDSEGGLGGAIYINSAHSGMKVDIADSVIQSNHATAANAGGLYCNNCPHSEWNFVRTTLSNNTSPISGGALYVTGTNVTILLEDVIADSNSVSSSNQNGGMINCGSCRSLTLRRVVATRNSAYYTGGIYVGAGASATNVLIEDSSMSHNTGNVGFLQCSQGIVKMLNSNATDNIGSSVGFLSSNGGSLDVEDSIISRNEGYNGGAVYTQGPTTITRTIFADNTATSTGGALYCHTCTTLTLRNSNLVRNSADFTAGGIYVTYGSAVIVIDDCLIAENSAFEAGAIYGYQTISTEIRNSTIRNNTASGSGGGAMTFGPSGFTIKIADSDFIGNKAASGNGGAGIFTQSLSVLVQRSRFIENVASGNGGAIYATLSTSNAFMTIEDTEMTGNRVFASGSSTGGAIHVSNVPILTLDRVTMRDNTADFGGGIHVYYFSGSAVVMRDSTLSGNHATLGEGGALYCESCGEVNVTEGCVISGNDAATSGGGMFFEGNEAVVFIADSTMDLNTAVDGGGLKCDGCASLSIQRMSATANHADNQGGVVWAKNMVVNMTSCVWQRNSADSGACLSANSSALLLNAMVFQQNNASDDGGSLHLTSSTSSMADTDFLSNRAGRHGGAIWLSSPSDTSLSRMTFCSNSAPDSTYNIYPSMPSCAECHIGIGQDCSSDPNVVPFSACPTSCPCKPGFFKALPSDLCAPCNANCSTCTDADSCLTCSPWVPHRFGILCRSSCPPLCAVDQCFDGPTGDGTCRKCTGGTCGDFCSEMTDKCGECGGDGKSCTENNVFGWLPDQINPQNNMLLTVATLGALLLLIVLLIAIAVLARKRMRRRSKTQDPTSAATLITELSSIAMNHMSDVNDLESTIDLSSHLDETITVGEASTAFETIDTLTIGESETADTSDMPTFPEAESWAPGSI